MISDVAIDQQRLSTGALAGRLAVGDLVFIRIGNYPFRKVSEATGSWVNHVGIVLEISRGEATIGESRVPLSGTTRLSRFVARSEGRRVAVARLHGGLTADQRVRVRAAARRRASVLYDTGFDIDSRRQFCSRYVREVLAEATGTTVGEVEPFSSLLARNPGADVRFWWIWYFGRIPWDRRTVTPASVLASGQLELLFDGVVGPG